MVNVPAPTTPTPINAHAILSGSCRVVHSTIHHFDTQTVKNSALCRKAARRCSANGTCACRLTVCRGVVAMLTHINNSDTQSRLDFTLCVGVCVALCQPPQLAPTIGDTTTPTKRISMGVYRRWNCGSWRGMLAAIRHRSFSC